ncbi:MULTISPECIES: ribonuclease [Ralstonia solanacearum species complex]|uniref:Ribonuclease N n=5 Tax=Ralstonia solanacearum species complex TaxID=3116862 RepID=A0AA92GQV3_RALSL|nr:MULTISPECIES: ribonuclease domain-containing protein [Ralstonia]AKZ25579.1 ribonuclease N [Ralstonia solanacearum]APC69525.1 ribonuclease N [Ralstonia solanacearum OE1-1]APF88684.1 ribonuclease N [Ralstonia solanacearum FJAT-1458]ARS58013.1 ribonuclease N [Ralstonia solanacearum FJAT-91]API73714.1 ribonuclease N [Ralstonia pseudosolanacearum]
MTKRLGAWIGRSVSQAMVRGALAAMLALSVAGLPTAAAARDTTGMSAAVGTIPAVDLPNEAQRTLVQIEQGGPFPYAKDGTTFGNYEGRLPARKRGYYREYTVKTRGARNRGARRIICGGDQRAANDCYYTEDHYNSFQRIQR